MKNSRDYLNTMYARYAIFVLIGVVTLISILVIYNQFYVYQQQKIEDDKAHLKQMIEFKILLTEAQINSIGKAVVSFYENSEIVTTTEYNNFVQGFINEVPDITNIFFTENDMIVQSYPHKEFIGSNFHTIFPTYPITIENTEQMAVEYKIPSKNQKIIVIFPFEFILSGKDTINNDYKLVLLDPQNSKQPVFEIGRIDDQYITGPIEFTPNELDTSITIDRQTNLFDTKIQQNHRLQYTIWSESEKPEDILSITVLIGGGFFSVLIPILLIRAERFKIKAQRQAVSLEKANMQLREIDNQKATFSTMITHELKTPLMPILGYSKMLKKPNMIGTLNKEQLKAVDVIEKNAKRLEELIYDILDARKLDMRKLKFVNNKFSIKQLIGELESSYEQPLRQKEIKFSIKHNIEEQTLYSDKNRLFQVFTNLISNAIKAVSPKTGEIEVGINQKDAQMNCYVKDNGIGIPSEKQNDIFKKFYQVDSTLTRKNEGSGLGLNISKGVVEGLGGKIWFESKEGKGTTFYFSIPINASVTETAHD